MKKLLMPVFFLTLSACAGVTPKPADPPKPQPYVVGEKKGACSVLEGNITLLKGAQWESCAKGLLQELATAGDQIRALQAQLAPKK